MNRSPQTRGSSGLPLWPVLLVAAALGITIFLFGDRHTAVLASTRGSEHAITIELAETDAELRTGLMGRRHLAADHGMLFDMRNRPSIGMWMKNVPIGLDMLFLDATGRVIYIKKNAKPNSTALIHPNRPYAAVLELPSGTADRLGIEQGSEVRHPLFRNRH